MLFISGRVEVEKCCPEKNVTFMLKFQQKNPRKVLFIAEYNVKWQLEKYQIKAKVVKTK